MNVKQFQLEQTTQDKLLLRGQGWEPDGETRAVVCLVHGHGEHCQRYSHMADVFGRAGYALIAYDLRGHGRSEGRRGHAPGYDVLMSDLTLLLDEASSRYPDLPRFLYGHSLGGNLAMYYALKTKTMLSGVIAAAPLLRIAFQPPRWKSALLDALYALRMTLPMSTGLERDALTRDRDVLDRNLNDPLAHSRITPQLAVESRRTGEWIIKHAAELSIPMLVMHGEADRITSAAASREFASSAAQNCTLKIWDGFFHELHSEPEKQQVFDYVMTWMNNTLA